MQYAIVNDGGSVSYVYTASVAMDRSRFLHYILCEFYGGEEFTVKFTRKRPNRTKNREYFHGENRGIPDYV